MAWAEASTAERLAQLGVELLVGQLDEADRIEFHGPQALVGQQIEHVDVDGFVLAEFLLAGFHAQDDAALLVGRL